MARLSRDQILEADDLKTEEIEVPEWNGSVVVRELRGRERDAFEEGSLDKQRNLKMTNMRARGSFSRGRRREADVHCEGSRAAGRQVRYSAEQVV